MNLTRLPRRYTRLVSAAQQRKGDATSPRAVEGAKRMDGMQPTGSEAPPEACEPPRRPWAWLGGKGGMEGPLLPWQTRAWASKHEA